MNVLVYSGKGSTTEGVRHTVESLRQCLSPYYAVITISEHALLHDPWMGKSAMLVFPGGADLPYCDSFNGNGNKRIDQFVRNGGKFIGFCAGGYYGSKRCEFEVGDPGMEVSGPRELSFFPGTCKGCVYKGFVYESHEGARAVNLTVNVSTMNGLDAPGSVTAYYNGGGLFMNASKYRNVEVLARYTGQTEFVDETQDLAAAVYCKVGKGGVFLSGVHPEYTPQLMKPSAHDYHFKSIVEKLEASNEQRTQFLAACLKKIGLHVTTDPSQTVPRLTPILMASYLDPPRAQKVLTDLRKNLDFVASNTFEDLHDTFFLHDENDDDYGHMFADTSEDKNTDSLEELSASTKHIKVFTSSLPDARATPYFNMKSYFSNLKHLYDTNSVGLGAREFGSLLCYGEVVTSTNTLLDANPNWLRHLPTGTTVTATTQAAGRGRGGNVWVNPRGVMPTSMLFRVPIESQKNFNIVTLQYLCTLAVIESILGYGSDTPGQGVGYEDMPLKLKWPNDMYALKPEFYKTLSDKNDTSSTVEGDEQKWAKVSGALVNSQIINNEFYLVWGCGVNVSNRVPTTSLNNVLDKLNEIRAQKKLAPLPPYTHEVLLARVVFTVGQFYSVFQKSGLRPFLELYYKRWFHSEQRVKLDAEGNGKTRECVIKGITSDYGLLVAEDIATRETLELQPDGNSFDIFKGLVYKKR